MVDLTGEMAALWAALGPARPDRGRVIQFISATSGEGTSTVAREFARLSAVRARKPVWLIDADLTSQSQQDAVAADPNRYGALGRPAAASPNGSCFFTVQPPMRSRDGAPVADARLLSARPCLGRRLWVSRFRAEVLRAGQRALPMPRGAYWDAMRRHAEAVIIDSPSADRSDLGLALGPFADAVVLVVAAEAADAGATAALKDELASAGARCAGLVFNRSEAEPPKFLRRLTG
ncbi:hfsB [Brevundimonas sp.]|uniref:hfsB n=1 Tax=Brevundimonas sp. TaxID=1871086 RepID=UPI0025FC1931|nr:hfsB [Brevundimonas sp.]